jgi:thiol-disulfide isomerase/thioredoxin
MFGNTRRSTDTLRRRDLPGVFAGLAAALAAIGRASASPAGKNKMSANELDVEGTFPSLAGATAWLNSGPLDPAHLRGKVVLVEFWTYTCINWLRTLPYVRGWNEHYKDKGLVVIGVHTPELAFEHDIDNVRRAIAGLKIDFPVATDNGYAIWNAFDNQYWPAMYFIDAEGRIRHHQFGEGDYDTSERVIQQLLTEAGKGRFEGILGPVGQTGAESAADIPNLESGETYVGYARADGFASPGGARPDRRFAYAMAARPGLNQWSLSGEWTMGKQALTSDAPGGKIAYRFHARDLHLVMGPGKKGETIRFRVTLDGKPPGAAHGLDVDAEGNGIMTQQRMHQLIRQPGAIADRLFEIEFLNPGAQAFIFTFG